MEEAQVASIRIYGFMSALRDVAPLISKTTLFCIFIVLLVATMSISVRNLHLDVMFPANNNENNLLYLYRTAQLQM